MQQFPQGLLLGLIGRAGAGKDTVAKLLAVEGFYPAAFADQLRLELAAAWRVGPEIFGHRPTKEVPLPVLAAGNCDHGEFIEHCIASHIDLQAPRSPRWAMQTWGEWRCASMGADYWVQHVERWVRYQRGAGRRCLVITDVRKPVEAAALRRLGGHLVRIHRPDLAPLEPATAEHVTEQVDELATDAEIHNDGDITHLANEVARALGVIAAACTEKVSS